MRNPAFKIWLEGQVIYATLNGIALLVIFTLAATNKTSEIAFYGGLFIVIGLVSEALFAIPAILLLAHWLRMLRSYKLDKRSCMLWSLLGFSISMYLCATLLWCTLTGNWVISNGNTSGFYIFTGAAIASAAVSMVMNYRSLYQYLRASNYTLPATPKDPNHTVITSETNNHES